jgi:hypothetical protein
MRKGRGDSKMISDFNCDRQFVVPKQIELKNDKAIKTNYDWKNAY